MLVNFMNLLTEQHSEARELRHSGAKKDREQRGVRMLTVSTLQPGDQHSGLSQTG